MDIMKILKKLSLSILSIICFLLIYEGFLQLTEMASSSFVYDDKNLGRTFKPSYDIFFARAEGMYMGSTNRYGYIGKGYPPEKSGNTLRIALLGDSYIEGMQVFERNHFRTKVEKNLHNQLNKNVEVLNFGIGGLDFRDMFFNYKFKAQKFNPDIAVFYIKRTNLLTKEKFPSPEYYLENDSLKLNFDFLNSSESALRRKFSFIRDFGIGYLLKESYESYYNGSLNKLIWDKFASDNSIKKSKQTEVDQDVAKIDSNMYDLNKKILSELNDDAKNRNIKIVLIITDDFPEYYYPLFNSFSSLKVILIPHRLSDYNNKEMRYWKASGIMGHWNQKAINIFGEFLTENLSSVIEK